MIAVGVLLSNVHHSAFADVARAADELGFESLWLGEHVVLPLDLQGELAEEDAHATIAPTTPILDVCAVLSWLAGQTTNIRLGTFVYLLGLRHPFVAARALATVDTLSGGRLEAGVGAGWIRTEWEALGADFASRGRCLDEAIDVCRRLWTEATVAHQGEFFQFPAVAFEPKPVQSPLPISIGGESTQALRRAVRLAEGWMGMAHTPETAAQQVAVIRRLDAEAGREAPPVRVTVVGELSSEQPPSAWADAGVDRLIVHPWARTRDAVGALTTLADQYLS